METEKSEYLLKDNVRGVALAIERQRENRSMGVYHHSGETARIAVRRQGTALRGEGLES